MTWVLIKSLAISYFHMANCHTIIGAKRFHCRVRDGIGWATLAMFTKQTGSAGFFILWPTSIGNLYTFFTSCSLASSDRLSDLFLAFRLSFDSPLFLNSHQTHWVLYGQASRAISTG